MTNSLLDFVTRPVVAEPRGRRSADQIRDAYAEHPWLPRFEKFHAENPHVYARFKEMALKLISQGHRRYSSKTLLCVIRFERDVSTSGGEPWKINDAFTALYARLFALDHPHRADFFEYRETTCVIETE